MIPFWIDTLCVPVGEKNRYLEGDKTRDLRKEAIGQMAETYRQADRVLVLDSFILKLPYSADVIDKYLGIHLSNWHHRLWTMQEGQLASRLFFQFRNGAQSLDMIKRYELHTIDRLAPQNLCSPVRLLCASELESFYRESELNSNRRSNITARLRSCAHYLRSRETSRSEDEAVCVANILGLDAKRILRHDGADDRMACLFDLIGVLDPRIIFHNHPRLKKDGYRWAPGTFLRQLPDIIVFPDTQAKWANSIPVAVIPGGGGFPVSFGGFEFSHESATLLRRGSTMFVKQVTNGLGPPRRPGDPSAPWFGCVYKMEVQQVPNDVHLLQSRQHQRWAVILPFYLEKDYLPFSGILGIIDDGAPPRPAAAEQIQRSVWTAIGPHGVQLPAYAIPYRIRVRFVCRVNVSMPAQETVPRNAPLTWVWAYNIQQEWCLR